ncbi:coenzyme F420-0:L-glutamate ligase [Dehalococcoidia bacterium]|nr:coenzyme F420-0:L-glutamate ligase [Dehalococcoidia bacterium]
MSIPEFRVFGLTGIPEVALDTDLASALSDAAMAQGTPFESGDVLVVTQKIVSKAEGCVVHLDSIEPSDFAVSIASQWDKDARHVEIVLRESKRIVRMDNGVIITENLLGHICANSGVDASNLVSEGTVATLPKSPDLSCEKLRLGLKALCGAELAVLMSDTFGRPWREGCTNVAIGVAGLEPLIDYSGEVDSSGFTLKASVLAVADELASATELVMGKMDRVPAAIVRGYPYISASGSSSSLLRPPDKDLFR